MSSTTDVAVIGSGIIGASCAWHLAARGLDVMVLEREPAPAMGSTGRSAAGVRVQFTTAANIGLSMYSLPVYRSFAERFGHDIGYRDIGYLLLVPEEKWEAHLEAVALQRSMGAPVDLFSPTEALRYVDFDTEGLAGASYGPWDGVIDPHMATHAWVAMGREAGVGYRFGSEVTALTRESDGWSVACGEERISCGRVVNAAGAWSGRLGSLAGLDVPVGPKRIQIFLSAPIVDTRTYPLTIDLASGVYLRSEGDRVLFGLDNLEQASGFTEGMDWAWMERVLLTGARRFPWWEDLGIDRRGSWWGYYGVTPDHSPIIGAHPEAPGWVDGCGFSGHGIMHAPAAGRAVSELIADGASHTVDVAAFGHERFGEDHAVERNVF
jgi:glycine/D-amino acid oxidase-like deaminating enzyme